MAEIRKVLGEHPAIGMIHLCPMIGYEGYPGYKEVERKMLKDARTLVEAGFEVIMLENNYDMPHYEKATAETAAMMAVLAKKLREEVRVVLGVDVLWNDYRTAFSICASTGASFIRVPAFVDTVMTSYGLMEARGGEVMAYRKRYGLENVLVIADVQVKHSEMVEKDKPLEKSVKEAVRTGAEGIIVTGKWTGNPPTEDDLAKVRAVSGEVMVLVGSGSDSSNIETLLRYANGAIVGTAIKEGGVDLQNNAVNLKPFERGIDPKKAEEYIKAFNVAASK